MCKSSIISLCVLKRTNDFPSPPLRMRCSAFMSEYLAFSALPSQTLTPMSALPLSCPGAYWEGQRSDKPLLICTPLDSLWRVNVRIQMVVEYLERICVVIGETFRFLQELSQ